VVRAIRDYGVDALILNRGDKLRLKWKSPKDMRKDIFESVAHFNATANRMLENIPQRSTSSTGSANSINLTELEKRRQRAQQEGLEQDSGDTGDESEPERDESKPYIDYLHPLAKEREEARLADLQYLDGLGAKICDVLRFWREQIESSSLKERQQAQKHLKAFGEALIPETRGKRQNKLLAYPWEVKEFYFKKLYRLYHIEHFLESSAGPRNHSLKVKQASDNYGLTIELVREFLGLDETDKPDRQPFTAKDMARELTARAFKISHQTVSNLLSS